MNRLLHVCRGVAVGKIENGGAYLYTMYQDRDRAFEDEWANQHGHAVA